MIHPIIKCIWFLTSVLIIAKAQVSKVDLDQAQPKDSISQDRMVPNYNPMFPGPHRAMVPNMNVNPYWSSRHPRHSGQKTSQWWQQLFMLQQRTQQQVVEILARLVQLEKRINVMSGCEKESMNSINLGKASAEIGIKLYNEEKKKKAGNLLFSPFSIQSALSLLALGSKGSTLNQIMDLVGGNNIESLQELKSQFGRALSTIKSSDQYTIESVNSLFVQENYKLKQSFVTDLKDNFGADIRTTNYAKPKAAADLINTYVEKKTHGKILDLISPSILGADTKIVLINALYFKGMWKQPFDKKKTSKQVFHLTDKKSIEIDFMNQEGDMKVGSYQGRTIVALPYTGDRFVMYLFIPHNIKPLSVLEELMVADSTRLTEALDITKFYSLPAGVSLSLPKFKIESSMKLIKNLEKLGVMDVFSPGKADLSGISGNFLYVSDAIHKAFIEVTEDGTEAAAATGAGIRARSIPMQANFNRPFVFLIKDEETGLILFQGRVSHPLQS